jgi:hypothetical protein
MYQKLFHRTWIIQLAAVALLVFCIAYAGARAGNLKSQVVQPVDPNINIAQSTSPDGVVILYSSLPGIARGQTLSLKFSNPLTGGESDGQPMPVQVRLLDADGNAVSESRQVNVLPGTFAVINFKRIDVDLPGDSLTGRVETSAEVRTVPLWGLRTRGRFGYEVFDDLTGKTIVALQPSQDDLVFVGTFNSP